MASFGIATKKIAREVLIPVSAPMNASTGWSLEQNLEPKLLLLSLMSHAGNSTVRTVSFDLQFMKQRGQRDFLLKKPTNCCLGTWLSSNPRKEKILIRPFLGRETFIFFYVLDFAHSNTHVQFLLLVLMGSCALLRPKKDHRSLILATPFQC